MSLNDEMAAAAEEKPQSCVVEEEEDKTENPQDCIKLFTFLVIKEYNGSMEQNTMSKDLRIKLKTYMNEFLHSIFSLAIIHVDSKITPDKLFSETCLERFRKHFPEPFLKYNKELPKRTPFSVLLDIMSLKYDTKEKVITELLKVLKEVKFPPEINRPGNRTQQIYTVDSTVIFVCSSDLQPPKTYFGASLCCWKKKARGILILSSCINTWHKYVSYVVMSYRESKHQRKQSNSNSNLPRLNFPKSMTCQAYLRNWTNNTYDMKEPCLNCQRMFSLPGNQNAKSYPIGNCAETECLSKLLSDDQFSEQDDCIDHFDDDDFQELKKQTQICLKNEFCFEPIMSLRCLSQGQQTD